MDDAETPTPSDLLKLLHGKFSLLIINFNDHAVDYKEAKDWHLYYSDDSLVNWASDEEKEKALQDNSVWTIQWYPDTPAGSYCVGASTFEAAARFALAENNK